MLEIEQLMKYEVAGDPMRGTKWIRRTPGKIAAILNAAGIDISRNTVSTLLKQLGFSLKGNRKQIATQSSPDREEQFRTIQQLRQSFEEAGNPIISVDTKKKELIGLFHQPGRVWTRQPIAVYDHDFRSDAEAIAVPYGIYDLLTNEGFINVGLSAETPEFAVNSIAKWWRYRGHSHYRSKQQLLILADCGGANGYRPRAWKYQIQGKLSDRYGLSVTVAHYPSGASKWNPVEHRLFSEISKNWAGRPLESLETMLHYIQSTTTSGGLRVRSYLDTKDYQKGIRISDAQIKQLSLEKAPTLAKWNYTISPR